MNTSGKSKAINFALQSQSFSPHKVYLIELPLSILILSLSIALVPR